MEIQCECGKFRAELTQFPKNTPGRLLCYCDDCQSFMHYLNRADLLDSNGGTEIIPVYPSDFKILQGQEQLKCTRLVPDGMFRYSTKCCNTPIANTDEKRPWVGTHRRVFVAKDPKKLDEIFQQVRASIMGKYGHGILPPGTPKKFNFKGFLSVMPFLLNGILKGRKRPSPFFENEKSIAPPYILSDDEYKKVLASAGHAR